VVYYINNFMKHNCIYRIVTALAVIGILLACFLLWERFFNPPFKPCSINSTVNCDAIISGSVSTVLGIPTAAVGLTGYIFIFIGALLKNKKLILGMATFGLIFCLWIAFREIIQLHVICPVCILCQLDMISVFILAVILNRKPNPIKP
jgi:uncharacterized membrane protein